MRGTGAVRVQEMEYLNAGEARDGVTHVGCVLGARSEEPVTHQIRGRRFRKIHSEISVRDSERAGLWLTARLPREQGWLPAAGPRGAESHVLLFGVTDVPQDGSGPCGAGGRAAVPAGHRVPEGLAVLSLAATLDKRGGSPCHSFI